MKYAPVEFSSENIDALYRVSKCSNLNLKNETNSEKARDYIQDNAIKNSKDPNA